LINFVLTASQIFYVVNSFKVNNLIPRKYPKIFGNRYEFQLKDSSIDVELIKRTQWKLLIENHCGSWKGIQTGYDPQNDEVADHVYSETILTLDENSVPPSIRHINKFVAGEIRTDYEVPYDAERVKVKELGVYTKDKLKTRLCCNAEVRGPGSTARGLSVEVSLRGAGDSRIRVLFSYAAEDFEAIEDSNTEVRSGWLGGLFSSAPSSPTLFAARSLELTDVVVTRERLNRRPLDVDPLDSKPLDVDPLWVRRSSIDRQVDVSNSERMRMDGQGGMIVSEVSLADNEELEEGEEWYRRLLPGDIEVEAPRIILLQESDTNGLDHQNMNSGSVMNDVMAHSIRVSAPSKRDSNGRDRVTVVLAVADGYVLDPQTGRVNSKPPQLLDFFVDYLSLMSQSASKE